MARRPDSPWFALKTPPPERLTIAGAEYRLTLVFKHDFWAATCLYEPVALGAAGNIPKAVVKFYRCQRLGIVPLAWVGRRSRNHERAVYRALAGLAGVPRWLDEAGPTGMAIEYIDARPIDQVDPLPAGFFDRLRTLMDQVHARGVAYVDSNKRSNILVDSAGGVHLIDFQISILPAAWPWLLRPLGLAIMRYFQGRDLYHLYKHKRRLVPAELTAEEEEISRRRDLLHRLHRRLIKPYKRLRRGFLRKRYQDGRLVSPTAELETHEQPEKETWRTGPDAPDRSKER